MSTSIYLIRHAQAGQRERWDGPDVERPLSRRGRDQAAALTEALINEPLKRIMSSPSLRCLQTVGGVALTHGLDVERSELLAEGAELKPALALLGDLATSEASVVLCAHGDLIPEIIDWLGQRAIPLAGQGCTKGSVWRLDVHKGRVVSGTYFREPGVLARRRS